MSAGHRNITKHESIPVEPIQPNSISFFRQRPQTPNTSSNLSDTILSSMPSSKLPHQPPMDQWRIIACTVAMCGIQVCYAAQINLGTAQLLLLGMDEKAVSLAWLAGPLSGLIVQPIVGHASDSCTSPYGRRRPFLLFGALFTALSLLLFANALPLARRLAPALAAPLALVLAVATFFLLDFSIQAIQAPLRALVTDVVPRPQRAFANSYIGVFTGLGNLIGGLLTAVDLKSLFPFFSSNVQALFTIAAVVLLVSVLICILSTPEQPIRRPRPASPDRDPVLEPLNYDGFPQTSDPLIPDPTPETTSALLQPSISSHQSSDSVSAISPRDGTGWPAIKAALRGVPRPFWRVFAVQLCTWCGFFTLFVYVNTWVARNVYLGKSSAAEGSVERELFEKGLRLGGQGNALTAAVTLAYSMALPSLLQRFGIIAVFAFSQVVEAASLLAAPLIRGTVGQTAPSTFLKMVTMLDIGAFGIVWATTMGVPWTLVGDALDSNAWYAKRVGLFTTLFNASQSFPQLVIAFIAPGVLALSRNDPAYVMFVGGLFAVVGVVLVVVLKVNVFDDNSDEELGEGIHVN